MAPEEVISRRRVIRTTDETSGDGVGIALAVALIIVALLALFALARGNFNPTPASPTENPGQRIEIEGQFQ